MGEGRGGALDMGSAPLETSSGSAPVDGSCVCISLSLAVLLELLRLTIFLWYVRVCSVLLEQVDDDDDK